MIRQAAALPHTRLSRHAILAISRRSWRFGVWNSAGVPYEDRKAARRPRRPDPAEASHRQPHRLQGFSQGCPSLQACRSEIDRSTLALRVEALDIVCDQAERVAAPILANLRQLPLGADADPVAAARPIAPRSDAPPSRPPLPPRSTGMLEPTPFVALRFSP